MSAVFGNLFGSYPALAGLSAQLEAGYALLRRAALGGTVMVCGNGGSAADSEHIVGELMKGFNKKRPLCAADVAKFDGADRDTIAAKLQYGVRAISLVSQTGLISAFANDCGPELVFAQQVFAYAQTDSDLLIALSTSGNSLNVVNAVKAARAAGIKSLAITGEAPSRLSELADVTLRLPGTAPYEVQEYTLPVYHALCARLEDELFDE